MSDKSFRRYKRLTATRRTFFLEPAARLAETGSVRMEFPVGAFDATFVRRGTEDERFVGWVQLAGPLWGNGGEIQWSDDEELVNALAGLLIGGAANSSSVGDYIPLDPEYDPAAPPRDRRGWFEVAMETTHSYITDQLGKDEEVQAVGRCADITMNGDINVGGVAWNFVMVTDRKLWWVLDISKPEILGAASLDLDDIHRCVDRRWRHRCSLSLDHDEIVRPYWARKGRYGSDDFDIDLVTGPLTKTTLAFSNPRTRAANALRSQLTSRGIDVSLKQLRSAPPRW